MPSVFRGVASAASLLLALSPMILTAQVSSVGSGAFAGATPTTFSGTTLGTEVNGVTVDGILFTYSAGSGQVFVTGGGPGNTASVTEPFILSTGLNTGILTLQFPTLWTAFGYNFAILSLAIDPSATTITLFNGATNLGSMSFGGAPDPVFTGGFAGIQSVTAFDRAEVTFGGDAFVMDNVVGLEAETVPEPATMTLLATGLAGMVAARRKRKIA